MTKEVFVSNELTGAVRASYSSSRGDIMPDGPGTGPEITPPVGEPVGGEAPKPTEGMTSGERVQMDMTESARRVAEDDARRLGLETTDNVEDEVSRARTALSELNIPDDDASVEEKRAFNTASDELARRAGILGSATWKNKDNDQPVNVTAYLGKGPDGREYVLIEGSTTGVPIDEIEFPRVPEPTPVAGGSGGEPPVDERPAPTAGESEPEREGAPIGPAVSEFNPADIPGYVEKTHRPKDAPRPEDTAEHFARIKARAEGGAGVPPGGRPPERPTAEEPEPGEPDEDETITARLTEGLRRGKVAEFPSIDITTITNPELRTIAEEISDYKNKPIQLVIDPALVDEYLKSIRDMSGVDPSLKDQADLLTSKLKEIKVWIKLFGDNLKEKTRHKFSLSLSEEDFDQLEEDPMEWLDSKIDSIHLYAEEGREASSQQISSIERYHVDAEQYLQLLGIHSKIIREFSSIFNQRKDALIIRTLIHRRRELETLPGIAESLGTQGLLGILTHENGLVGKAFNRIQDLYDDVRAGSERHHITPEEHSKIQQKVIDEYLEMVEKDPSLVESENFLNIKTDRPMSAVRKRELIEKKIIRSVRAGYDHFVDSQREAVIVARGEALLFERNLEGILADPSALFMMFNYEQLLIAKFGIINKTTQDFLDAIKRKHAESILRQNGVDPRTLSEERLIEYGTELQRDLMHVNDFYSSPWRIEKFLEQTRRVLRYNSAKEFYSTSDGTKDDYDRLTRIIENKRIPAKKRFAAQEELSRKIGETMRSLTPNQIRVSDERAEDFSLFMRLRFIHKHSSYKDIKLPENHPDYKKTKEGAKRDVWAKIARYKPEDIVRLFREKSPGDLIELDQAFRNLGLSEREGMTLYDVFKEEYGGIISLVRETGLSKNLPEQIDFSKILTDEYADYRDLLVKVIAGTGGDMEAASQKVVKLKELFEKMQDFGKSKIDRLVTDTRFEYIYQRTYSVNDALMDRLENVDTDAGLIRVSKLLSAEIGGDAYKRTMSDANNANQAQSAYLMFLSHEDIETKEKSAKEAAEKAALYNTPDLKASVFYYTFGSYLQMGAITLSGSKLGTLYEVFDIKKTPRWLPINELQKVYGPHAPAFNIDQMVEYMDKYKDDLIGSHGDGRKLYDEMRRLVRIIPGSRAKFMGYRGLMFAIMYLMLEAAYSTYKSTGEGLAADELKAA